MSKFQEMEVTPSLEDYLEMIFFLKEKNGDVRVTDMAAEMNISKPSVNKAIKNLKAQGLVVHERYGLLYLTEQGLKTAKAVARRHMVIKKFLIDVLGVDSDTAEDEACKIEHGMSVMTVDKLAAFLDTTLAQQS